MKESIILFYVYEKYNHLKTSSYDKDKISFSI